MTNSNFPQRRIIIVDDDENIIQPLKENFARVFGEENLAKWKQASGTGHISDEDVEILQSYSPEIVTCKSLEEIPSYVVPNPNVANFWILDQMLKKGTSELVYMMMGIKVGKMAYPMAKDLGGKVYDQFGGQLSLLEEEINDLLTKSDSEVVDALGYLHETTGMMIGYSSMVAEIFTFNTDIVFSLLGDPKVQVSSPLVLFKEKGNLQQDTKKMAQAYLLSAIAYGNKLPWNGVALGSKNDMQTTLPTEMHQKFSTASRESGNTLDGFLKTYGAKFVPTD